MRWVVVAGLVMALSASAFGDGVYVSAAFGRVNYRGGLERFDHAPGTEKVQLGLGYVRGPWAFELFRSAISPSGFGSYAREGEKLELTEYGTDVRRAWLVVRPRWTERVHLDFVLHGGPRIVSSPRAWGVGLGGGAAVDLNMQRVSAYIDFTASALALTGERVSESGRLSSVTIGIRLGWM